MKLGPWPKRKYILTPQLVRQLREDFENGMNAKEGAKKYGISAAHFRRVGRGVQWRQG